MTNTRWFSKPYMLLTLAAIVLAMMVATFPGSAHGFEPPLKIPTAAMRFCAVTTYWSDSYEAPNRVRYYNDSCDTRPTRYFIIELQPYPTEGEHLEAIKALQVIYAAGNGSFPGFMDGVPARLIVKGGQPHGTTLDDMVEHGSFNPFVAGSYERWIALKHLNGEMVRDGVAVAIRRYLPPAPAPDPGVALHPSLLVVSDDAAQQAIRANRIRVLTWLDGHFDDHRYQAVRSHAGPGRTTHARMIMLGRHALADQAMQGTGWTYYLREMELDPLEFRVSQMPYRARWEAQLVHGAFDQFNRSVLNSAKTGVAPYPVSKYTLGDVYSVTEEDVWKALGYVPGTPTIIPMVVEE